MEKAIKIIRGEPKENVRILKAKIYKGFLNNTNRLGVSRNIIVMNEIVFFC